MSMNKRNFVAAGMGLAGLWTASGGSHFDVQRRRQHQAIEAFTTVSI